MNISINQSIPDMSFDVFHEEKFSKKSFSDFDGKWLVVMFYPADFSYVCPTELKEAQGRYEEIKKMGAEIISVSCDSTYVHKAWHDSSPAIKQITYPMAADPSGALARAFGIYVEEKGESLRGTFIINPKGVLMAMDIHNTDIGRSISEIIRKLTAFQYVAKHHNEVCPAGWTTGDKTIKKSVDLIGKI